MKTLQLRSIFCQNRLLVKFSLNICDKLGHSFRLKSSQLMWPVQWYEENIFSVKIFIQLFVLWNVFWWWVISSAKQMLTTIFYLSNFTICKSVSLPFTHSSTYIQIPILYSFFLFCGQSYKASTSVKYYSRVVLTSKLLKFRTLMT